VQGLFARKPGHGSESQEKVAVGRVGGQLAQFAVEPLIAPGREPVVQPLPQEVFIFFSWKCRRHGLQGGLRRKNAGLPATNKVNGHIWR
jgi:hypothetical protein